MRSLHSSLTRYVRSFITVHLFFSTYVCFAICCFQIIFLTALFYLLSNSDEKYYPLAATNYLGFSSGPLIAEAIETSISSVLIASAKLALFHGLFMWLTHTIFGARVVFLPAAFAAMLAAVPFLGTYWCSLPAFLDLWLIQDRFVLGIILVFIHVIFPTTFVDPAIYADVSGWVTLILSPLCQRVSSFLIKTIWYQLCDIYLKNITDINIRLNSQLNENTTENWE